jgi:membrane-associated protease RseP (regulator of RpoE activity)
MTFLAGLWEYKWIILFYLAIIAIVYIKRKKFDFQAKFIALYRTKVGVKLIDKIGTKHSELIKIIGYCGIGIGYIGMIVIMGFIFKGIYDLIFVPSAPPVLSPVIPGVPIPGSPVMVPFWHGIIALFIVVAIHEFAHGIVARAHKIPVKNTGIVFFGPLIGAFVEPDEKKLEKKGDEVKYSVFAAGPWSNVITAAFVLLLMFFVFNPVVSHYAHPVGVEFTQITEGLPADVAGLQENVLYNKVGNQTVNSTTDFVLAFEDVKPGEEVYIGNDGEMLKVIPIEDENEPDKALIGVNLKTVFTNEHNPWMIVLLWISELFNWIFILSLGLGLANLLPLGPVDGGRMIGLSLMRIYGEKKGKKIWSTTSIWLLAIILILVFVPIIKALI